MIVIVNYGIGNSGSIFNMLRKIGAEAVVSSDPAVIKKADKLILPGVGSFDNAVMNLKETGLFFVLTEKILKNKIPVLGICLGMQLLTKKSEEGKLEGLGLIDAETVKFDLNNSLKIPHMGWNTVTPVRKDVLFLNQQKELRFYFIHSYHVVCKDQSNIVAMTNYGYDFPCAISRENIFGVQFHPEKSHGFGMEVLKNFVEL